MSEVRTLLLLLQTSGFRILQTCDLPYGCPPLPRACPHRVSSSRCVELAAEAVLPRTAFLPTRWGRGTGRSCIDATPLQVGHTFRSKSPKVFKDSAPRGVSSTGGVSGVTGHLGTHDGGGLLAGRCPPGHVEDRKPVPQLARRLFGKLLGDRGYHSPALFSQLWAHGGPLLTKRKKKRPPRLLPLRENMLRRPRPLIATVNEQLKNICQLEPTRHRRLTNGVVNVRAAFMAYTAQEKKPSLHFRSPE